MNFKNPFFSKRNLNFWTSRFLNMPVLRQRLDFLYRTPVPFGLYQKSFVEISKLPIFTAKQESSFFPKIKQAQTVIAVGRMIVRNRILYRAYLSDGKSYIQMFANSSDLQDPISMMLFSQASLKEPQTSSDIESLIGSPESKDFSCIIGLPHFVYQNSSCSYTRSWDQSGDSIAPFCVEEDYIGYNGHLEKNKHWFMLYERSLLSRKEYALIDFFETENEKNAFRVDLGLDLDRYDLKVFSSHFVL